MTGSAPLSLRARQIGIALVLAGVSHFWLPTISLFVAPAGWVSMISALVIYFCAVGAVGFLISSILGIPIRSVTTFGDRFDNVVIRALVYFVATIVVMASLLYSAGFTFYQFERAGEIKMESDP